jgi:hypothetical protein
MNCQNIAMILDDANMGLLPEEAQHHVQQHLSECSECAFDHAVSVRLSAAVVPDMPADFASRCRAMVAARQSAGVRARARTRFVVIGTMVVVAAAAAMLAVKLMKPVQESQAQAVATRNLAASAVRSLGGSQRAPITQSAQVAEAVAEPTTKSFSVEMLPVNLEAHEPLAVAMAETFRAHVIQELRAVPNLVLVESGARSQHDAPAADYLLTVNRLVLETTASGSRAGTRNWSIQLKAAQQAELATTAAGKPSAKVRSAWTFAWYGATEPGCVDSTDPRVNAPGRMCFGIAQAATSIVRMLRVQTLPPDPAFAQMLQAQVLDNRLDFLQRESALGELRTLQRRQGNTGWDAVTVRSAIDLAAAAPDARQRAQMWRELRGAAHPDLVQPLLDSLRQDPDVRVRVEAATTLAADFADDPAVRAALESAAQSDDRTVVRMAAQRALSGDAVWRQYVSATLRDQSLSDAQRLEPLLVTERSQVALDDDAMAALAEILPREWAPPAPKNAAQWSEQTNAGVNLVSLVGSMNHPATVDLLLVAMRKGTYPLIRENAARLLAIKHRDDPRVRQVFEALAGSADAGLRVIAEGALRSPATP